MYRSVIAYTCDQGYEADSGLSKFPSDLSETQ